MYLSLHCHHRHESYIKMGSDESCFNVFFICDGQSHQTTTFEEKGEPKRLLNSSTLFSQIGVSRQRNNAVSNVILVQHKNYNDRLAFYELFSSSTAHK